MDWHLQQHDILDPFPSPLLILDQAGGIVEANPAIEHITEYTPEEMNRMSFISLLANNDAAIAERQIQKINDGEISFFEADIIAKYGKSKRLQFVLLPFILQGKLTAIHVFFNDINQNTKLEKTLSETQEHLHIFETLDVSIWSLSIQENRLVYISPATEKIYKRTLEEFRKDPMLWKSVIHEEDIPKVEHEHQKLLSGHSIVREYRILHPDGEIRWVLDRAIPRLNDKGELFSLTGIVMDITERKTLEKQIWLQAYQDLLTGLPNRKQFEEILEKEVEISDQTGRKMALLTLNVNRYKQINDTLGDTIADKAIKILAERLTECVPAGSIVARIREDDFAVLLKDTEPLEEILDVANRFIEQASNLFSVEGFEFHLFANIGISLFPQDCSDQHTLINHSAVALHRAKQQGNNNIQMYTSVIDIESYQNYTLERDLYKAIERNEFTLLYQPKVDTYSYKIIGVEALIRWNHPEWGVVAPSKFISIAEETDLIVDLGDWVLRQACLQNKAWQLAGFAPVRVSVNMSPKQFLRKDMITKLMIVIEETQLDPKWLEFEITENTLLQIDQIEILEELKNKGITVSLDDFGTGYSSLSYIKQINPNVLKLDKSFIRNLGQKHEDKAIVKAVIGMAHDLKISVIAEGVETKDQLYLLQSLKCDEIQGFLFSEPIPADVCEKLLAAGVCPLPDEPLVPLANVPNRRQFFRIEFPFPLRAEMTVEEINGKKINIGYTEILIENISAGGLRFLSTIEFPRRSNVLYKIRTELMDNVWEFWGSIVWEKEIMPDIHQNGVMFRMDEDQQSSIIQMLNQLSVKLRRDPLVPKSSFMAVDKNNYLLGQLSQTKNRIKPLQ
jgi:diguanylate cyclase (GGDEF)-like protein/PAS domain S-box-containing protein